MKRDYAINLFLVLTLSSIGLCSATPTWKRPWLGVHVMLTTKDNTEQLAQVVKGLAEPREPPEGESDRSSKAGMICSLPLWLVVLHRPDVAPTLA